MNAPLTHKRMGPPQSSEFVPPTPQTATVLVTGAGHRIGRSIALELAADGWPVIAHYNSSNTAAQEVSDTVRRAGGRAEVLRGDLSDPNEAKALIGRASGSLPPVGVLINNASVFEFDDISNVDTHSWDLNMDINLKAPLFLSQAFSEQLPERSGGVIVNVIDSRVLNPTPGHTSYTLSKSALWTLTQTMAKALAPRIRVNAVGPGPTLPHAGQTLEEFKERCKRLPLKQPATPAEIAETIRFLISVKSITGQFIALDGGDHLVGHITA
ncbi:MAG: SDR family oxidoreductase [Pseudomonadota bacterium]